MDDQLVLPDLSASLNGPLVAFIRHILHCLQHVIVAGSWVFTSPCPGTSGSFRQSMIAPWLLARLGRSLLNTRLTRTDVSVECHWGTTVALLRVESAELWSSVPLCFLSEKFCLLAIKVCWERVGNWNAEPFAHRRKHCSNRLRLYSQVP